MGTSVGAGVENGVENSLDDGSRSPVAYEPFPFTTSQKAAFPNRKTTLVQTLGHTKPA